VQGGQDEIGREQMAASINEYLETYKQACTAYAQQNYEVAATLVDEVVQNVPDDPNCHLLRGHIYYVLQQYDVAQQEYQKVLQLSDDVDIIGFANNGLENINQDQHPLEPDVGTEENYQPEPINFASMSDDLETGTSDLEDLGQFTNLDSNTFDFNPLEDSQYSDAVEESSLSNPFDVLAESDALNQIPDVTTPFSEDPFAINSHHTESELNADKGNEQVELELPIFWQEDGLESSRDLSDTGNLLIDNNNVDTPFAEVDFPPESNLETIPERLDDERQQTPNIDTFPVTANIQEDETLFLDKDHLKNGAAETDNLENNSPTNLLQSDPSNWLEKIEVVENLSEASSYLNGNSSHDYQQMQTDAAADTDSLDSDEGFDFEAFESAFGSDGTTADEETNSIQSKGNSQSNIEFLDDFDEFDDLGNIPGFELADADSSFGDVTMLSGSLETSGIPQHKVEESNPNNGTNDRDDELFSITGSHTGTQDAVPIFTQTDASKLEPNVSVEQGWLAPLENAPLDMKPWFVAGTVGVFSALVVATVSFATTNFSPPEQRESVRNTGWSMSLAAGLASFGTAAFMGSLTLKQIRRTTKDLQAQFDAVRQGNMNVQATVYSEDELGRLATGFNEMARVIFTTTHEAQRKADEQEEAKENLQRQVIRLLDDVEGAARGDLTVQAEVTADVLGAVADAFNLTIQNLRDIVQQVKVAAKEVTKGATNSETFARALSSDALRQAEELGVTLNSVQVMTDSIQRVAEAAREAETVARDASAIALKGGEAVENTVAGILEIRETVAETTRKVKRLAESSQEISKIVALISQIASRTNLLALNASIEAARAGEAGRGFAIVADEVRQLADKSAKSLKEIEQIVMQIQSETGSVMTAMEEGTQQVIKGTKLAEEAKRSLENIIQVANRIDTLVCSITSDTVEQTETSRAVAHVMQSVELTAQETSQEAQRVSGALQLLVGVSRDLISSVERFRVETLESR
jgi:twitching motility protein PilJ